MFENAGVPRTERTILSWCQPNKQGITKLNCYFDPADRKWFLTPSSVDMAIKEEQNRLQNKGETQPSEVDQDSSEGLGSDSEGFGSEQNSFGRLRKDSEPGFSDEFPQDLKSAQAVIRDLEITNKAKDYFIELLQEREKEHLSDLNKLSHEVGVLETKLKQLGAPKDHQRVIVQEEDDSE
ncbi:hypothetical protein GWN26_07975, partial [Candidatus Saccharibacteria bacterium]|nr:hypothetical protein [Candidatus Saccharibacteria bacterium]NIW79354.1 hypothetical protein [Calditrichia bacterium]